MLLLSSFSQASGGENDVAENESDDCQEVVVVSGSRSQFGQYSRMYIPGVDKVSIVSVGNVPTDITLVTFYVFDMCFKRVADK